MKNIFKSSKHRKSLVGALLAAVSLFSFNFTPISVISSKLAMAAKYEATETKITENTSSTQIEASSLESHLKEYFLDSRADLNLSEYYSTKYKALILEKAHDFLSTQSDYKTQLGTNKDLAEYFSKAVNQDYLEFIYNFISNLDAYKNTANANDRKSLFYSDFAIYLGLKTNDIENAAQDGITDQTTNFYNDSDSYKLVKSHIDGIIKETIAIVSYDGTDNNKVAAIIADNAPSDTLYTYGSSYQKHPDKYIEYSTSNNIQFSSEAPFFYITENGTLKQYSTLPYETNSNGSLVVYAVSDGSASRESTYEFLGYKSITLAEQGSSDYIPVTYSNATTADASYFKFLYKQLISNNKINSENISEEQFVELFYTQLDGMGGKASLLCVKYDSTKTYLYNIYVTAEDYAKLGNQSHAFFGYEYTDYVSVIDSDMKDYVKISDTNTQLITTYKANQVGDVTLYFKKEISNYTSQNVIYLTDDSGDYIYETELKLDIAYEETSGKKNIYVLDDSENASENKVYQALGYTVIKTPTIDYVKIESTDDNYNEKFSLYYKYADTDSVFAKNLLTLSNAEPKNAIYVLSSSVESDLTSLCKMNGYIPVTKDEISAGYFTKLNAGDPHYSTQYELYYRYDVYELSDGTFKNAKKVNKVYQYTSGTSEYYGFYKTDANYNLEDYSKITDKTDTNYKQGFDLYYKKQTKTETTNISKNTIYNYASKNSITFSANSYYAISFYVNTTGTNVSASVELVDENKYLSDTKITNIQTSGKWVKYYMFVATNLLNDSKVKLTLSMGSTEGIAANINTTVTGSVLFDDVIVYKINETDYNKQTINNELVYITDDNNKIDSAQNNNKVVIAEPFSARLQNDAVIENWNSLFDFDSIDSSVLSNSETYGGQLQNVDINKIDGYSSVENLWQYYISRGVSGKNNSELLDAYRKAYKTINSDNSISSNVEISITDEKDEKSPSTTNEDTSDNSNESTDSASNTVESGSNTTSSSNSIDSIISDTFNNDNKILKIKNTSASMSLGVISKPFTLSSSECYKISLWIYSADKKSTATIKLISNILTAQNNEYGIELSAGASDINAYLDTEDKTSTNEYRWLPVTFYVQGNVLSDQEVNLVLLADENSTVYFDNIKIEKVTTKTYTSASASAASRVFKLALTDSNTTLSKVITNGFFNDKEVTDLAADATAPIAAQNWTTTSDAAQDYVTAGIISSKNTNYTTGINNLLATNMYVIDIAGTDSNPQATHKIYNAKTASLSANSVYKVTFEYYYASNNFEGDVISNLYYSSYKAENKISSIRTSVSSANENANKWNSITFYVATGTSSVSAILELGVEDANGRIFIRNAYATTISKTLDQIRSEFATNNDDKLTLSNDKINIVDFSAYSFTMNENKNENDIIASTEVAIKSAITETTTTGKTGVIIADYFTETSTTQKTITVDKTTYYLYDNDGTLELYKYPIYDNTTLANNEKLEKINNQSFVIRDGKVVVGAGSSEREYEISEKNANEFTYVFENDIKVGDTTISASELSNNQSNNVLVIANSHDTDYSVIESKYKMTLNASSYYALKFYVKTSDFEKENFGLSIDITATSLDISWSEDLINTTDVETGIHKDANGFVCYQMIISTNKSSYNDLIFKISLGNKDNTGKGYAIISKVELTKLASEDEYNHYTEIFANEEDDSIVKTTEGSTTTSTTNSLNTDSEVTWATFFYIFSSLLLVIVLVIAMIAIFVKKHPIKHKAKNIENENFDIDASNKTKEKINKDQEIKNDGGIE